MISPKLNLKNLSKIQKIAITAIGVSLTALLIYGLFQISQAIEKKQMISGEYISKAGLFSVDLPEPMFIRETQSTTKSGDTTFTQTEIVLTYEKMDDESKEGLRFIVVRPYIEGKGGGCTVAQTQEIIASQEVNVCEGEGEFNVSYFKHPSKEIEYNINLYYPGLKEAKYKKLTEMVRKTLRFI